MMRIGKKIQFKSETEMSKNWRRGWDELENWTLRTLFSVRPECGIDEMQKDLVVEGGEIE